ncbi:GspH/FimT family pseudopilin [Marinomonas transparens]|uniref:Type II secretion system protein H n=1 Tax=Marinomonas transparens TaxID=2795388 RepID=A0A934JVG4_9GAMM|nr:GspH/FimT family pseudopilin [Marinomonas transparens]MBJ7539106.1 GspH/FimT family pseudopilin [Marinomonas transparens]
MDHQSGFSLLELICVLAILSILAYVGSSQLLTVSQDSKDKKSLTADIKALSEALLQARQLAVASGEESFVCGGDNCSGNWSSGLRLYQASRDLGEEKEYRQITFEAPLQVSWRGFPANKKQIEYQPNGLSGYQNGTFLFCLGRWQGSLVLNQSGRFYIADTRRQEGEDCL